MRLKRWIMVIILHSRFKADNGREYERDATIEYVHYVRVIKSASEL